MKAKTTADKDTIEMLHQLLDEEESSRMPVSIYRYENLINEAVVVQDRLSKTLETAFFIRAFGRVAMGILLFAKGLDLLL